MSKTPLISVIIPSHNSPDLPGALISVLEQDYPRMELILIDDGSTAFSKDETESFIQQHRGPGLTHFEVLVNGSNQGTVRTLNRATARCEGEYIFTLAGDDRFFDKQVLSDWVAAFQATGAQVMTGRRALYNSDLTQYIGMAPTDEQICKIRRLSPRELFEDLARTNYIFGCCTARTAESVRRYGPYDEGYRLLEDHPMNLRLLRQGEPIVFFDRMVVRYRSGGASDPLRYDPVYGRDVDRVLTRDVLPYTRHPGAMKWHYARWKADQKLLQKRALLSVRYGPKSPAVMFVTCCFALAHPIRALRKLVRLLTKGGHCK